MNHCRSAPLAPIRYALPLRSLWLLVLLLATLQAAWAEPIVDVQLAGTRLRFASLQEAQAQLGRSDEWVDTTGDLQRAVVLGVPGPVSREQLLAALPRAALEWTPAEERRWRAAAEAIAPKWAALGVRLPETVLLVSTDGSDGANAPYTRGAAVFLPRSLNLGNYADAELMAHELFHVLSRHNPALATRVYATLGFEAAEPLEWPAQWAPTRLSNPDAPHHRHIVRIETASGPLAVMPVLVARRTTLSPGETFFQVLDVRLLAVTPGQPGRPTRALEQGGQPRWLPAFTTQEYLSRLGGNTAYVIHPEEAAADNVAFVVSGRTVRNPGLLLRVKAALAEPPSPALAVEQPSHQKAN